MPTVRSAASSPVNAIHATAMVASAVPSRAHGTRKPPEGDVATAPGRRPYPQPRQPRPLGGTVAGMPKVQAYVLPADDLRAVAQQSGLQWVNSDADKVHRR